MHAYRHRSAWMGLGFGLCLTGAALAQSASQPASTSQPSIANGAVGTVKGTNVYIRSGFSTNYYPVCKLNRGDQVRIAGEQFGWLKIEPPPAAYSLIDKKLVDKATDKKGTVNGAAQVYAGSDLDEHRYAKQVKLAKGDSVDILGETADGAFYKIAPPPGAHVWVKAEFIDTGGAKIAGDTPRVETVKPGELSGTETVEGDTDKPKTEVTSNRRSTKPKMVPNGPTNRDAVDRLQMQINAIETEVAAEGTKPLGERNFEPMIAKLQQIADQQDDEISAIYARTRIGQLKGQMEIAAAVAEMDKFKTRTIADADALAAERARIEAARPKDTDTIVVRGEIRASGIYNGAGNRPKRWRIVESGTNTDTPKTIAYLEVPEGSPIDPSQYYGQTVGIRASSQKQLRGTVPPVPIFSVREIVLNPPPEEKDVILSTRAQSASPVPVVVTEPTSQPAGETTSRPSE